MKFLSFNLYDRTKENCVHILDWFDLSAYMCNIVCVLYVCHCYIALWCINTCALKNRASSDFFQILLNPKENLDEKGFQGNNYSYELLICLINAIQM